jgi:hypothetical protein
VWEANGAPIVCDNKWNTLIRDSVSSRLQMNIEMLFVELLFVCLIVCLLLYLGTRLNLLHAAQFVGSLFFGDTVNGELALHIVQQTKELASLGDGNHIHEPSGEVDVGAHLNTKMFLTNVQNTQDTKTNLVVNQNQALHHNSSHLLARERIL